MSGFQYVCSAVIGVYGGGMLLSYLGAGAWAWPVAVVATCAYTIWRDR